MNNEAKILVDCVNKAGDRDFDGVPKQDITVFRGNAVKVSETIIMEKKDKATGKLKQRITIKDGLQTTEDFE